MSQEHIYEKAVIKPFDSIEFLKQAWDYDENYYYSIVVINNGIDYKHFSKDFEAIKEYLENIKYGNHVYFQVLPLSKKPDKGRGDSSLIEKGKWLWIDFDYKQVVENPHEIIYEKSFDHALTCYYKEGEKWIYVKRPPLNQVLEEVKNKIGFIPTIVVDSGGGYHFYFKLTHEIEANKLKELENWLVDKLGGDPQAKDLVRIMRLPGSINPRVKRLCKVIFQSKEQINPEVLFEKIQQEEAFEKKQLRELQLRELNDSEILRIIDLIRDSYKPGFRQSLCLYLSGWLAKARISPISVIKIIKTLYESTGDEEQLKTRLGAVVYSFKKAGINIDEYSSDIERIVEVKPYGLEREINENKIKGISGLQEIFERTMGEEKALAVLHELSEILQTLSPYHDSIIELIDYEKQIYVIANLRKKIIARAKRENNTLIYKERICVVSPTRVFVYSNPIGGITKYEIVFEGTTLQKPLVVGPATIDEIADRLIAEGLVYHRKLIYDSLSAIAQAFIRKGKAELRTEIESPGFYFINNKIIAIKIEKQDFEKEKLRESLKLLNELAEVWFKHIQDKFSSIIKWGTIAPFGYVQKQRGKWIPWLYLFGDSATGKTTLGRIILKMWGLDTKHEKTGASIDTIPRIGYVLSMSTFPVLINEPGNALTKEEVIETIKNAIDTTLVRGKYIRGAYSEIPALSNLIFTSNKFFPKDDALLRRLKIIQFSFGEKIPIEKQREFKEKVEQRLNLLSEVGKCIIKQVLDGQELDSKLLLENCYRIAELEIPQWLNLEYVEEQDFCETIIEEFIERFRKYVNDLFAKYISRIIEVSSSSVGKITPDSIEFERRLRILLEKNLLPGCRINEEEIIITSSLLREIELENKISLKSLAELLNWEYGVFWLSNKSIRAIKTQFNRFLNLFTNESLHKPCKDP
ncbi:MAG: hypothetical protein ABIL37_01315 [candidate division WOR-3 bacterium]